MTLLKWGRIEWSLFFVAFNLVVMLIPPYGILTAVNAFAGAALLWSALPALHVKWSWRWGAFIPETCDACGARAWLSLFTPTFRPFDVEDGVGLIWRWAFWFGPLHVRREWPMGEDNAPALQARIDARNKAILARSWDV